MPALHGKPFQPGRSDSEVGKDELAVVSGGEPGVSDSDRGQELSASPCSSSVPGTVRESCLSPRALTHEAEDGEDDRPASEDGLQGREEVASRAEVGDDDLPGSLDAAQKREALICENLHLVPGIVRKFKDSSEPFEDLIQVGYVGLIKAVDSFDRSYKVKFTTYATHFINGEIRHYLRDRAGTIKKPRWLSGESRKMAVFIEQFLQKEHRLPGISEIALGINVSEEGVIEILKARSLTDVAALDESIAVDKIRSLRYETFKLPLEDRIALQQTIEKLKQLEKKAVYLFFYHDLTQTEIAQTMGVSQKKVSRLLQRAIDRLREIMSRDLW